MAGMDAMVFMKTRDRFRRNIMHTIAISCARMREEEDLHRAKMIASEVSKIFSS